MAASSRQLSASRIEYILAGYGRLFQSPAIVHPKKMPMRFYRIVDRGTNQLSGDEPTISIISPANNFVATSEMIVSATAVSDLRQWTFAFL